MRASKRDGWFDEKKFQHFDMPWTFARANAYVSDDQNIQNHSFLPFLSFDIVTRRFRAGKKTRPIRYASHRDNYVYSFFARNLNVLYEDALSKEGLDECVLAYRSKLGNNITFANEAFDQIERLSDCVAIGFDIESFFDTLDHDLLKSAWIELVDAEKLSAAEYAVFRSVTKYAFVSRKDCYKRLHYNQRQRRKRPLCTPEEFRKIIKGRGTGEKSLIERNMKPCGIPQGSSISACLANIYMFEFDKAMNKKAVQVNGVYRRYSDDILWIVKPELESEILKFVAQEISKAKLSIQAKKTVISHFVRQPAGTVILQKGDKPLQYLGFCFDGQARLIRAQTLSRFWRRVVRATWKAKVDAWKAGKRGRSNKVHKRQVFKRYSYLGEANFISYVKQASLAASSTGDYKKTKIWRQTRTHFRSINHLLNNW